MFKTDHQNTHARGYKRRNSGEIFLATAIAGAISAAANAQQAAVEEVLVTGTRATIQGQIDLKRNSTEIVDGMNAEEIGALPALSIGEALETITGAASHRENGGASEISVRGMGPFLGTTVVNGREATNGSGNRAVNFSIFPSEMFNKIAVHKTQSAKYIEGAVSGQIHLDTRRPIDYGKQRIQVALKGSAHPDDADISGQDEIGYRATASYINAWDTDAGTFGISIGGQKRADSNPEAEATVGTGGGRLEGCQLASFDSDALPLDTSGRCHDGSTGVENDNIQNIIDADPNDSINSVADIPWAYIPRSRQYRQNTTDDEREALFGAIQWQPNDVLDIMVDFQSAERDQKELRRDLQFGGGQNNIRALVSNPRTGVLDSVTTDTDINSVVTDFQRLEEYQGFGFNVGYQVTDTLKVSFDAAYSDTERTETDIEIRLGTTNDGTLQRSRDEFIVAFDDRAAGTDGLWLATILCDDGSSSCDPASLGDFDITDLSFYTAQERARIRGREQIREMTNEAYRVDFTWDTENLGFINSIEGGIRFNTLEYLTTGGNRIAGTSLFEDEDFAGTPNGDRDAAEVSQVVGAAVANCGAAFPESGFLSESRSGQNLVTVANDIGNGSSWATFDHNCAFNELLANYGGASGYVPQRGITSGTIDLTEDTYAIYLQANYESEIGGKAVRGNFGVRVVETEVDSVGYRTKLTASTEDDGMGGTLFFVEEVPGGEFEATSRKNSYTEVLPSVTFIMDLSDDLVFRAGAFGGYHTPDPHSFGAGREIETNDADDLNSGFSSLAEAVQGIEANGNPKLESLPSWNLDAALEWYVNDDTMVSAGIYWKEFQGGFESVVQSETFIIDGNPVEGSVRTSQVSDRKSELIGFEFTATHAFDYLPGFLSGTGAKFSYNYADSDFEFEDGFGGDGIAFDAAGNPTQLIGIVPPAGLFGLSRHTSSSQLYWQNERFNIQLLYKTRSQYFQAFGRDTTSRIRYVDDSQTFDLRMTYDVTDNITLSAEGLNLLNEPRIDFRPIEGSVQQTLEYGPRVFVGVRAKF